MLKKEIGLRIRNIRLSMNLSKQKFARLLGISGQYLGMIERGEGSLSVEKLKLLCELTNLSSDYILFGKDSLKPFEISKVLSDYSDEEIKTGCATLENLALFLKHIG